MSSITAEDTMIDALVPVGTGRQFLFYGDSCSGIPGHPHTANLQRINAIAMRLNPSPDFIIYPGDEVIGLTGDETALRDQWRHWREIEMAGPRSLSVPIYNCPGNHTVYDAMSETVYREACDHLPRNGPDDQKGLSYFVRDGDFLLVIVNTLCSGLGGEGHVETDWLKKVLRSNSDARWKLVCGHHPVFPVNGYAGDYQRTLGTEYRERFWSLLVDHGVMAYLCSHILAFDVQVRDGVLQLTSAGAGTAHRMPEDIEYLHCVQVVIDSQGLRYQVLDDTGRVRETLKWPLILPASLGWPRFSEAMVCTHDPIHIWRMTGRLPVTPIARRQTILAMSENQSGLDRLWIGLQGKEQRLTVSLSPRIGRSPHSWYGPPLGTTDRFDVQIALHADMGPGGILWRGADDKPWSTLSGASAWGPERLDMNGRWTIGYAGQPDRQPFAGKDLRVAFHEGSSHL